MNTDNPLFIIVDLFCGFGGTTTGFCDAEINGQNHVKHFSMHVFKLLLLSYKKGLPAKQFLKFTILF